jgi:hypothetical protein
MLKKLKKGLKKAAKVALPVGAALLAAKAMGKKKQKPLVPKYFGGNTTGDATIAENMANFNKGMDRMGAFNEQGNAGLAYRATGGRVGHKKGGRVGVGVAKRGFGRAMKGKK